MGKDFQKSALSTLFKFARIRVAHQTHVDKDIPSRSVCFVLDGLTRVPLKSHFRLTKFTWIEHQFIYTFKRQNHSLVRTASCPVLTYYSGSRQ